MYRPIAGHSLSLTQNERIAFGHPNGVSANSENGSALTCLLRRALRRSNIDRWESHRTLTVWLTDCEVGAIAELLRTDPTLWCALKDAGGWLVDAFLELIELDPEPNA